jgi:hypothetical protein
VNNRDRALSQEAAKLDALGAQERFRPFHKTRIRKKKPIDKILALRTGVSAQLLHPTLAMPVSV